MTVGSSGGYQQIDSVVPISATANPGYRFAGWTGSVTFADASAANTSLTMPTTAETVTANFVLNTPPTAKGSIPTQNVAVGQSVTFSAADIAEDQDGDPLSISSIVTPPGGSAATASLFGGSITLTGVAVGTTNIVVVVSDGDDTTTITVPISVLAAPVAPPPTRPPSQNPNYSSYTITQAPSDGNDYTAACNGAYSKLTGVYVDNRLLGSSQYSVWDGSTYVKLDANYVNNLSAGTHTLTLQFTDGSASSSFEVARQNGITGIYILPYSEDVALYTPSVAPSANTISEEKVNESAEEEEITDENDPYQSKDLEATDDGLLNDEDMPTVIAPATGDGSFSLIAISAITLAVALGRVAFVKKRFVG